MANAAHLSQMPEGATLLAWHNQADAQAVRLGDQREVLLIDGQEIPLDPHRHHHPVQFIVNLAHCHSKIELADHLNALRSMR